MNVLLTCAGRRSFMVSAFKWAVKGSVFACDASGDAPALRGADGAFVTPRVDDGSYIDALLEICGRHNVGLLIPALEPELPLLAESRERFLAIGTTPLVSSPEIVALCHDKLEASRFLEERGVSVPRSYLSLEAARKAVSKGEILFPLAIKPRWGVSSIGIEFAGDDEELSLAYNLLKLRMARGEWDALGGGDPERSILIQERLRGVEYGLDIINDLDGRYVCTFAKRKLRMHAGQTDRAVTVKDVSLEKLGRRIGEGLGHSGMLDCDVFAAESGFSVIDLNPRIGGGYPYSHMAGANFPAALAAWASGKKPDPAWFEIEPGIEAGRADLFVVTRRPEKADKNEEPMRLSEK